MHIRSQNDDFNMQRFLEIFSEKNWRRKTIILTDRGRTKEGTLKILKTFRQLKTLKKRIYGKYVSRKATKNFQSAKNP